MSTLPWKSGKSRLFLVMAFCQILFCTASQAALNIDEFRSWRKCIERSESQPGLRVPHLKEALKAAEKMGHDSPWYSITLRGLTRAYLQAGLWSEAEKYASQERKCLEAISPDYPDLPETLLALAECRCAQGDFKRAIEYLLQARRIVEHEPTGMTSVTGVSAFLSLAYAATNEPAKARKCELALYQCLDKSFSGEAAAERLAVFTDKFQYDGRLSAGPHRIWFYKQALRFNRKCMTRSFLNRGRRHFSIEIFNRYWLLSALKSEEDAFQEVCDVCLENESIFAHDQASKLAMYDILISNLINDGDYKMANWCLDRSLSILPHIKCDLELRYKIYYYKLLAMVSLQDSKGAETFRRTISNEIDDFGGNPEWTYNLYVEMASASRLARDDINAQKDLDELEQFLKRLPSSHKDKGRLLTALASVYCSYEQTGKAEELINFELAKALRSGGIKSKLAAGLKVALANTEFARSRPLAVRRYAQEALAAARAGGDSEMVGPAISMQANSLALLQDYAAAEAHFARAARYEESKGNWAQTMDNYRGAGFQSMVMGRFNQAGHYYALVENERFTLSVPPLLANQSYINVGETLLNNGRWREAIPYLERALALTSQTDDRDQIWKCLRLISQNYANLNEPQKCQPYLPRLQSEARTAEKRYFLARLNAILAKENGQEKLALRYLNDSRKYCREITPVPASLEIGEALVDDFAYLGFMEEGLRLSDELIPLAVQEFGANNADLAIIYAKQANLYDLLGRSKEARAAIDRAFAIASAPDNRAKNSTFSRLYRIVDRYNKDWQTDIAEYAALKLCDLFHRHVRNLDGYQYWNQQLMGDILYRRNKLADAEQHYKMATELMTSDYDGSPVKEDIMKRLAAVTLEKGDEAQGLNWIKKVMTAPCYSRSFECGRQSWLLILVSKGSDNLKSASKLIEKTGSPPPARVVSTVVPFYEACNDRRGINTQIIYANLLIRSGRTDAAKALLASVGGRIDKTDCLARSLPVDFMLAQSRLSVAMHDLTSAEDNLKKAIEASKKSKALLNELQPNLLYMCSEIQQMKGDLSGARQLRRKAADAYTRQRRCEGLEFRIESSL